MSERFTTEDALQEAKALMLADDVQGVAELIQRAQKAEEENAIAIDRIVELEAWKRRAEAERDRVSGELPRLRDAVRWLKEQREACLKGGPSLLASWEACLKTMMAADQAIDTYLVKTNADTRIAVFYDERAKDRERIENLRNMLNEALSCSVCDKACLQHDSFRYCKNCHRAIPERLAFELVRESSKRAEAANKMLELLAASAYLAIDNCIIGPAVPKLIARYERLKSPQPGDWVIELSSAYRSPSFPANIGRLILVREEPHPDWEGEEDDEPAPMVTYWYIETFDGSLQKWYDCQFYTLYTIKDLDEDTARLMVRADPPRLYDPAETRAKWARDAAFRHKLIVWEPADKGGKD